MMALLIALVAALLPLYLVRFRIGPLPSTGLEILLLITLMAFFLKPRNFSLLKPRLKPWFAPLFLLLTAGVFSILIAPNSWSALGLWRAYLLWPILFFLVMLAVLQDQRDLEKIFIGFGLSALVVSLYALGQKITGLGLPLPWAAEGRVTSFYPFPNAVGLFLGPLIPLFCALALKWSSGPKGVKIFFLSAAIFSILAIIFSKTEAAWIGVAAGLFLIGISWPPLRRLTLVLASLVLILFFSLPNLREPALDKILLRDWSGQVRLVQWREAAAMLQDRPFLGAGLAAYPIVSQPYHRAAYLEIFQYPHNLILNFWTELGLLGLLAFGWIIVQFFKLIIQAWKKIKNQNANVELGLAAAMLALLVHGLVDVPYFKNDLAVEFWILIAAVTILWKPSRQMEPKSLG